MQLMMLREGGMLQLSSELPFKYVIIHVCQWLRFIICFHFKIHLEILVSYATNDAEGLSYVSTSPTCGIKI